MRWIALPAGIVILLWTLLDVFRTLVMPRAARGRSRLSRILFRPLWRPWRWVGVRRKTIQARERILAGAAPFFFFVLLFAWVSLALLGYALILWSPAFVDGIERAVTRSRTPCTSLDRPCSRSGSAATSPDRREPSWSQQGRPASGCSPW